jgi:hypothetical protein
LLKPYSHRCRGSEITSAGCVPFGIRTRLIATGPQGNVVVGALVHPATGAYLGHGSLFAIYHGPQSEGHGPLLNLVKVAVRFTDGRIAALEAQFDAEAKAIPADVLLKLPNAQVRGQDPRDMNKSRGDVRAKILRERDETTE